MKKKIFLILLVLVLCFRMIMSWKIDKNIISHNMNISKQLEKLELDSVLLYKRILYHKYNSGGVTKCMLC